jgi:hypothetical protein
VYAEFSRNTGSERRFAKAWRAIKKDVAKRVIPFTGCIDRDQKTFEDFPLPNHVGHFLRAKRSLFFLLRELTSQDFFSGHGDPLAGEKN